MFSAQLRYGAAPTPNKTRLKTQLKLGLNKLGLCQCNFRGDITGGLGPLYLHPMQLSWQGIPLLLAPDGLPW